MIAVSLNDGTITCSPGYSRAALSTNEAVSTGLDTGGKASSR